MTKYLHPKKKPSRRIDLGCHRHRIVRYIGDAKFGRHVGTDSMGNRYYENTNPMEEVPGKSVAEPSVKISVASYFVRRVQNVRLTDVFILYWMG